MEHEPDEEYDPDDVDDDDHDDAVDDLDPDDEHDHDLADDTVTGSASYENSATSLIATWLWLPRSVIHTR